MDKSTDEDVSMKKKKKIVTDQNKENLVNFNRSYSDQSIQTKLDEIDNKETSMS